MKTMSQVLKAMLLSFVLTSFAPSVVLASANVSAVQEGDTEDLEAVKKRLMIVVLMSILLKLFMAMDKMQN